MRVLVLAFVIMMLVITAQAGSIPSHLYWLYVATFVNFASVFWIEAAELPEPYDGDLVTQCGTA